MESFKEFFDVALETLFPSGLVCFICGDEVQESEFELCNKCAKKLPLVKKHCLKCGSPIHSEANYCLTCKSNKRFFDFARSAFIYQDEIAYVIQELKYNNKKYLARPLAKFLEKEYLLIKDKIKPVDFIIPIPLSKERFKKRGYNQSELLARELSKLIDIPTNTEIVERIKNTETQTKLSFVERQENLNGAFKVTSRAKVKNKSFILIDDVLTTGSTVSHCAEVLKRAGAKAVYVLTVATTNSDKT